VARIRPAHPPHIVPADCKLLTADNLQVDESQLTGESVPVAKYVQSEKGNKLDSPNATVLFTGSVIEKGVADAVVYAIGNETELGKIASLSTKTRKITQYEKSLQAFSSFLIKVVLVTLVLTFSVKIIITANFSQIPLLLLFIVALAIAVVPEALPVLATVTLSRGAMKLAKQDVIVKRLSSGRVYACSICFGEALFLKVWYFEIAGKEVKQAEKRIGLETS
jgi:P-type Mg2+ transporter